MTLRLYVHAPFAVCRSFTAGWYRPTAAFLTPSAAYGLLLNIAGIESRLYEHEEGCDGRLPASLTRSDIPACRVAVGLPENAKPPAVHSLFQQLHNYPVGSQAAEWTEQAKGNKNNITPVRRELLVTLHAVVSIEATEDEHFESRIVRGLRGELNAGRYGLPFVGDNNLLIDRLEIVTDARPVRWYRRVASAETDGPRQNVTRLTTYIDRADTSRTRSALFAPADDATTEPPDDAWTNVGPGLHA